MKIRFLVFLLFAAQCSFAAYQYNSIGIHGSNNTAITHQHGGSLQNMLYFNNSATVTAAMVSNPVGWSNVSFGMYTVNNETRTITNEYVLSGLNVGTGPDTFDGKANAGEYIGFWVKNEDTGAMRYSTPGINGVGGTYAGQDLKNGIYQVGFSTSGYFGSPSNLPNSDLLFQVTVTDAPSGQPLPGVIAVLAVGAAAVAARKFRKRRAAAN